MSLVEFEIFSTLLTRTWSHEFILEATLYGNVFIPQLLKTNRSQPLTQYSILYPSIDSKHLLAHRPSFNLFVVLKRILFLAEDNSVFYFHFEILFCDTEISPSNIFLSCPFINFTVFMLLELKLWWGPRIALL
jgi:hypothetical protein